jgi:hypothetical protein
MIRPTHFLLAATLAVLLTSFGCQPSASPPDETAARPLTSLTSAQQQQKQRALAARDQMFQALVAELTSTLESDGPARAIEVCQKRAPEIAATVSEETGLRIGRTSFRLRNPDNQPPAWAASMVSGQTGQPVDVALPDGHLGVLLPIRLQSTCLLCHGSSDQIPTDVKVALAKIYPRDQATGFSEGDLRGYFWIEVPAAGSP